MDYMSGHYTPASAVIPHVAEPAPSGTYNVEPEALVTKPEPDMAEPIIPAEELIKGTVEPVSTTEQRRWEAPPMEWDATRSVSSIANGNIVNMTTYHANSSAPPEQSRPEASNFPSQHYTFNQDKELFRAPKSYPEPPKDMWYKVPESKPAPPEIRPPPIFPWEQRDIARPTRVFADDISSPAITPAMEKVQDEELTPITPSIKVTSDDPWSSFESRNAWDQVTGIDRYVRALNKRNKSISGTSRSSTSDAVVSPAADVTQTPFERRESLILTDFPSEIDRPSLPVTPAPMRRPMFWGEERDQSGKLPSAEGVPDQADWVCCHISLVYPWPLLTQTAHRIPMRNLKSLEGILSYSLKEISPCLATRSLIAKCPTVPLVLPLRPPRKYQTRSRRSSRSRTLQQRRRPRSPRHSP